MKLIEKLIINKNTTKQQLFVSILKLNFNNDIIKNTENDLKIKETDYKIGFNETDIIKINKLYSDILETYKNNKTEAFLLSISIFLISEITKKDYHKILDSMGIL